MESMRSAHGVRGVLMESLWRACGVHEHSDMFGKIYLIGV